MRVSLLHRSECLSLWRNGNRTHSSRSPTLLRLRTEAEAEFLLRPYLGDWFNRQQLRAFLRDDLQLEAWRLDDVPLVGVLARLLVRREVLAAVEDHRLALPPPLEKAVAPPPPVHEATTTWIEIQLVWDHDGEGVGQLEFVLEKPDDERTTVTTNGQGLIRLEGLKRGACLLEAELKCAEAASSAYLAGWGDRPSDEAPIDETEKTKIKHLVAVESRRVRPGETLERIADEAGLSWQALSKFNWGTDEPKAVARGLADRVGTQRREKPADVVFSKRDNPGILFLPRPFSIRGLATSTRHILRIRPIRWPFRRHLLSL